MSTNWIDDIFPEESKPTIVLNKESPIPSLSEIKEEIKEIDDIQEEVCFNPKNTTKPDPEYLQKLAKTKEIARKRTIEFLRQEKARKDLKLQELNERKLKVKQELEKIATFVKENKNIKTQEAKRDPAEETARKRLEIIKKILDEEKRLARKPEQKTIRLPEIPVIEAAKKKDLEYENQTIRVEEHSLREDNKDEVAFQLPQLESQYQTIPSTLTKVYTPNKPRKDCFISEKKSFTKPESLGPSGFVIVPSEIVFKDVEPQTEVNVFKKPFTIINKSVRIASFKLCQLSCIDEEWISVEITSTNRGTNVAPGQCVKGILSVKCSLDIMSDLKLLTGHFGIVDDNGITTLTSIVISRPVLVPIISLDPPLLSFGSCVIGEKIVKTFKIKNEGFLQAKYFVRCEHVGYENVCFKIATTEGDSNRGKNFSCSGVLPGYASININVEFCPKKTEVFNSKYLISFYSQERERICRALTSGSSEDISLCNSALDYDINWEKHLPSEHLISFSLVGECISLPMLVEKRKFNFSCLRAYQLYRESIVLHNASTSSLKYHFRLKSVYETCKSTTSSKSFYILDLGEFEISPDNGIVQPSEKFTVWIKIIPSKEGSKKYEDGSLFHIFFDMKVANYTLPVEFEVFGQITNSEIIISPNILDFGECIQNDGKQLDMTISSKSILPEELGFLKLPEYLKIKGSPIVRLEPNESVVKTITFSPHVCTDYSFDIFLKSANSVQFKIGIKGSVKKAPAFFYNGNIIQLDNIHQMTVVEFSVALHALSNIWFEFPVPIKSLNEEGLITWKWASEGSSPFSMSPRTGLVKEGQRKLILFQFCAEDVGKFNLKIPCYIKDSAGLTTIFLEIRATVLERCLEADLVSFNLGQIFVAESCVKMLNVKNLSLNVEKIQILNSNPLEKLIVHIEKPELSQNEISNVQINYMPRKPGHFIHNFKISNSKRSSIINIKLYGEAFEPSVVFEPLNRRVDLGAVLLGEAKTGTFSIHNTSSKKLSCLLINLKNSKHFKINEPEFDIEAGNVKQIQVELKPQWAKDYCEIVGIVVARTTKFHRVIFTAKCVDYSVFISGSNLIYEKPPEFDNVSLHFDTNSYTANFSREEFKNALNAMYNKEFDFSRNGIKMECDLLRSQRKEVPLLCSRNDVIPGIISSIPKNAFFIDLPTFWKKTSKGYKVETRIIDIKNIKFIASLNVNTEIVDPKKITYDAEFAITYPENIEKLGFEYFSRYKKSEKCDYEFVVDSKQTRIEAGQLLSLHLGLVDQHGNRIDSVGDEENFGISVDKPEAIETHIIFTMTGGIRLIKVQENKFQAESLAHNKIFVIRIFVENRV